MPEKDPTTWSLATWALAICMSFGGGLVNWYGRMRRGHVRAFNLIELAGEIFTSGFVGLGAFMALSGLDWPTGLCAAAAGTAGHMSTRLLFVLERWFESRLLRGACSSDKT
ncbi:MAG: hypothetical protein HGA47_06860 [Zoogloea sp.]|nr:hypothetical protein [Zoogloea sp.]